MSLTGVLPDPPAPDALYEAFVGWTERQGLALYPHQEEAVIELFTGSNVILATPTGSGKSLVAVAAHFAALAEGRVTFYTAPIKALVSEKFFALCETFGAENVGMLTGDAAVNSGAPIICCTAEVLANIALREGAGADVGQVVMDEFHFYAEPERGWAWQVPLLSLPRAQFLLMSATLGDVSALREDLTRRTGRETALVDDAERPVPLDFSWSLEPLHELLEELVRADRAPVYVVHFTQASALERAQALVSAKLCTREERAAIADAIGGFRFSAGFGRTLSRLIRSGVGVHHAGMLPRYRRLVEQLAQTGLLKVICGTDTLGVGINVPIRTVVFTGLAKFDGSRQRILKAREFHQIAGRAGRAGFDAAGYVVVQAPEHAIDRARAAEKAGDDPKKLRKLQRSKPADGVVGWTEETFERLRNATPETLVSRMRVNHAMILNVINQPADPVATLRALLEDNHEDERGRVRLAEQARSLSQELLASGVLEALAEPDEYGRTLRLAPALQADFALNQPLASFAQAAFDLIDPEAEAYALDVLSVVESILDDPTPLLMAQAFKERGEAVAEMKAEGIEYDERMELLEQVTHPRPLAEPLEQALRLYRETHPWVLETDLSPKSVVRDMYESGRTFTEFVSYYGVARSEGLVLRYLSDAARAHPDRGARRHHRVARRDGAPDRLEPARRVGDADRSRRRRADAGRGSHRRAARAAALDHRQRARVSGDGPQRHVPEGSAGRARSFRGARPARDGRGGAQRAAGPGDDDRRCVGGATRRLLGRARDHGLRARRARTGAGDDRPLTAGRRRPGLDGATDPRRSGRPPRLGDRGYGRPRRLRRRGRTGDPHAVARAGRLTRGATPAASTQLVAVPIPIDGGRSNRGEPRRMVVGKR
jgi:replicative superfamily II helicase